MRLLSQYDSPLNQPMPKTGGDNPMVKVSRDLDMLWEKLAPTLAKTAGGGFNPLSFVPNPVDPDNWGAAAGTYATAGGLGAPHLRGHRLQQHEEAAPQRAILEKAMQRRQRRQFNQSPTSIYAVPEPVGRDTLPGLRANLPPIESGEGL